MLRINTNVKSVIKRRDKLFAALLQEVDQGVIDGDAVSRCAGRAIQLLPDGCNYTAVHSTLLTLVGRPLQQNELRNVCWALAANVPDLRAGNKARMSINKDKSAVVVQILASSRRSLKKDSTSNGFPIRYRVKLLSGPGTPSVVDITWSSSFVQYLATRPDGLGFRGKSNPNKPIVGRPYQHHSLLVGMRVVVVLSSDGGRLKIEGVKCTESLRKHNRQLIEQRWRNGFQCPYKYTHHCFQCPKGQNSCPVAVRPKDYELKVCQMCQQESEHDVVWDERVCVRCTKLNRKLNK